MWSGSKNSQSVSNVSLTIFHNAESPSKYSWCKAAKMLALAKIWNTNNNCLLHFHKKFYFSGNVLQKKCTILRTTFKSEYNAQKNVSPGSGALNRDESILTYFEHMSFLHNSIKKNNIEQSREKRQLEGKVSKILVNNRANLVVKSSTRNMALIPTTYEGSLL